MKLISHYLPYKTLCDHIQEVIEAAHCIVDGHSNKCRESLNEVLLEYLCLYHDSGKATDEFQEFILNPAGYKKNRKFKRHSLLSSLLFADFLINSNSGKEDIYIAIQCISGHHTKLKTYFELESMLYDDADIEIIEQQLKNYHWKEFEIITQKHFSEKFTVRSLDKIRDLIEFDICDIISKLDFNTALYLRLRTQLYYSILLEADKALLITSRSEYKSSGHKKLYSRWVDDYIGNTKHTKINLIRDEIRWKVKKSFCNNNSINSLTAPTGTGKTLLSANWALKNYELLARKGIKSRIIIVLPFLSIITQTYLEYHKLLCKSLGNIDGSYLINSSSITDYNYKDKLEEKEESFFIDTWDSSIVVTTYDQFLYSIFHYRSKHQMRFHNIMDSVIIMDEVQSLPPKLWRPLESILYSIVNLSESKVLVMSATLPSFIRKSIPLLPNYKKYFATLNRYRLDFSNITKNIVHNVDEFNEYILENIQEWLSCKLRLLITLNTRKSAQHVYLSIKKYLNDNNVMYQTYFISSDVIPLDRMQRVVEIKKGLPCIVVSTQSIEAGVDIDMDLVFRDFAPLDSIIQIAGRCNRNGFNERKEVKIFQLKNEKGKLFSEIIYNSINLQKTRECLKDEYFIDEKNVIKYTERYFDLLMSNEGVSLGDSYINKFAYWKDYQDIKTVLRGEDLDKYDFVLLNKDNPLIEKISKISQINNKWNRREKWKRISSDLNKISLSITAYSKFEPENIAVNHYGLWFLKEEFYDEEIGFIYPVNNKV